MVFYWKTSNMIQTDQKKVIVQQIKIKRRIDSKLTIVLEKEKRVIKKVLKIGFVY